MQKANPNPNPNPNVERVESLSLEQVSKSFSLPLSDAAEFLGVSTSALKTICYENGIMRWPYRKFVGGKSIEQIKRDAIAQKSKGHIQSSLQEPPPNPHEFNYCFPSHAFSTISFHCWEYTNCPQGTQLSTFTDNQHSQILASPIQIPPRTSHSSPAASLSDLRNKAVKEGKAAFKLGVYKGHGIDKLDRNKRSTLIQIFKSSLPSQWEHGLS